MPGENQEKSSSNPKDAKVASKQTQPSANSAGPKRGLSEVLKTQAAAGKSGQHVRESAKGKDLG